jgi:type I restriction enzyme S subunit
MSKEVRSGYKLTEIGVIPDDWEARIIGDVVHFSGGSQPPRSTFIFKYREGYIRLIQIRDYKTDEFITYIPEELARKRCTTDDVMIGRYGPPIFQILRGIQGAYNVALLKSIPSQLVDLNYWYYYVQQERLFCLIEGLSQSSSGQTGVDMPSLKAFRFLLPPLPEQQAIASVLSDTDTLIASLDKLIAKKRDIKQAAMQQLLTGKQRLEGFGGDWEIRQLGDVAERIIGGGTPSRSNNTFWDGEIPWVTVKDFASFNPYYSQEFITKEGLKNSSSNLIPKGTVITSTRMALGKAVIYSVDVSINQDLKAIIPKQTLDSLYLYYWFQYQSEYIDSLGSGSTVKGILLQDLKKLEFLLPTIEEQQAIAKVLSDMDSDIIALEQRRDKTKAIKQAMMQELLTGRIRLLDTHTLAIPKD